MSIIKYITLGMLENEMTIYSFGIGLSHVLQVARCNKDTKEIEVSLSLKLWVLLSDWFPQPTDSTMIYVCWSQKQQEVIVWIFSQLAASN